MSVIKSISDYLKFYGRHNPLLTTEIKKISSYQKLGKTELERLSLIKRSELLNNAASNSTFYRSLYSSINLNKLSSNDFNKVPIITKQDIKAREDEIVVGSKRLMTKAFTSGTSGTPLAVYRSYKSILKENAYLWYFRNTHGLNIGDPMISIRGVLDSNSLFHFNKAENILYLSSYCLSTERIEKYFDLIKDFKPKAIWGYPSSIYSLVQLLKEKNLQVSIPLLFTSSETLYDFQRASMESFLSGRVFDWYGNAERTIALGQCAQGNYHEMPLYSYNEYQQDGIVTTSYINGRFPLIRYFVDDRVEIDLKPCKCGQSFSIKQVVGRADDVVKLSDGTIIGRLDIAFKGVNNILYAQIIQNDINHLLVCIVPDKQYNHLDETLLVQNLRKLLNATIVIKFKKVDESQLTKSKAGKFKLVVSGIHHP